MDDLTEQEMELVCETMKQNEQNFISNEQILGDRILVSACKKMLSDGTIERVEGGIAFTYGFIKSVMLSGIIVIAIVEVE